MRNKQQSSKYRKEIRGSYDLEYSDQNIEMTKMNKSNVKTVKTKNRFVM